jgi:hypothetical protein
VRYWAKNRVDDTAAVDDMAVLAPTLKLPEPEPEADFEVWEENWLTLNLFFQLQTQWRVGMGGATGLDYSAIPVLFDLYGVEDRVEVFEGIQVCEVELLLIWQEKNKSGSKNNNPGRV